MGSHKHCQDPACFCVDTVPAKAERRVKVGDAVVKLYPYPLNLFAVAGCGFRVTSATDKSLGVFGMTAQQNFAFDVLERLASEALSPAARAWLREKAAGK